MINRDLYEVISSQLNDNKVIIILGARQVGKTTLLEKLVENYETILHLTGDDSDVRELLSNASSTKLKNIIGNVACLYIDEAQRI
jgi:predicted AAA+ superfamily ATPase